MHWHLLCGGGGTQVGKMERSRGRERVKQMERYGQGKRKVYRAAMNRFLQANLR